MLEREKKIQHANKVINELHTILFSYVACKQYYLAKIVIDFIIEVQQDSIKDTGIFASCIDKLTEVKFDLTNFYNYVQQFDVKIIN